MKPPEDTPRGGPVAEREAERVLAALLADERLGVLSTHHDGQPYASLVAFVADETMRHLLFATPRPTRKFANLAADPRVAMLIDSSRNSTADISRASAATAVGSARELTGDERATAADRFAARHPYMADFVGSPSTALLCIEVETWFVVRRFQHVTELHLRP